ncbi:MAG: CpaF family protein, partial [Rhodospirillales bacterium]|nr:CpaF family protein [Rhodospirillales bacterium]
MHAPVPAFGRRAAPSETVAAKPDPAPAAAVLAASAAATPPTAEPLIAELRAMCLSKLDPSAVATQPAEVLIPQVELLISEIATERRIQLNGREQRQLATELVDDMLGLGPLEPLLEDESINDIMVNGPNSVFVERRGKVFAAAVRFRDTAHLINVCQRIAAAVGRRVDESSPMVDARLKDGSRVNIVVPPLALDGPYVSIRKFSKKSIDFAKLIEFGAMSRTLARVLEIAGQIRLNIIISGGTGSGKTTLLNATSRLIDHGERVVTVEDAAELQLQQPHVVRLETRPANLEGRGEINQRDLVRNALRMRPDRIVVGEARGAEALDMLQAMNTGHEGGLTTVHANSARDTLSRLETMVLYSGLDLPVRAIREQVA